MVALRTKVTEIVTGLGMLGYQDIEAALSARPTGLVNVAAADFDHLTTAYQRRQLSAEFEMAWRNGVAFMRADDGLRGRPPLRVEWKGSHKPPSYEQIPADLRVDHVYLVSCKYGSSILHNVSPSHLFDRLLAERKVERGNDWFSITAPEAYQEFFEAYVAEAPIDVAGIPARVENLDRVTRRKLKSAYPKRARLGPRALQVYQAFSFEVARTSAERWRSSFGVPRRDELFWRMLRLQAAPYFVLGDSQPASPLSYRVDTPWDFRSRFKLNSFDAWPEAAGQPLLRWRAEVTNRDSLDTRTVQGRVEIRWTHGRFSGAPEAKVLLDSHPHDVPGYHRLR